jgi:hypothetical protein
MTTHQLDLLAVISLAVCWGTFALAWLAGAVYDTPDSMAWAGAASFWMAQLVPSQRSTTAVCCWEPLEV